MKLKGIEKKLLNPCSSIKYEYSEYSEMDRDRILEEIIKLEEILPNCIFYVDHNIYQ